MTRSIVVFVGGQGRCRILMAERLRLLHSDGLRCMLRSGLVRGYLPCLPLASLCGLLAAAVRYARVGVRRKASGGLLGCARPGVVLACRFLRVALLSC
jgi:hypothetical protein